MTDVSTWNPVDDANTAAPPNGWPEFMMPSGVNNCGRMMMGAVRRMYDSQVDGSLVLPYLKLSGGTVTGAVTVSALLTANSIVSNSTINANAGITAGGNISASGSINAVSGFATASGSIVAGGNINTTEYRLNGVTFAKQLFDIGTNALYDATGQWCLALRSSTSGENYYANNTHRFVTRNNTAALATLDVSGLAVVGAISSGGGLTVTGAITGLNTLTISSNIAAGGGYYAAGLNFGSNAGRFWANADIMAAGQIWARNEPGGFGLHHDGATNDRFLSFKSECRFRFYDASGNLQWTLPPSGTVIWAMQSDGFCYANLNAVGGHGGYVDLSDERLKEEVTPATQGLAEVLALQPVTFVRTPRAEGAPQRQELGFVAQAVKEALPPAVTEVELPDGPALGITSGAIVAALVNAMKTIDQRLTAGGL